MFSRFNDFVEENNVEKSDSRIDQYINLKSRFSEYFPEAINDK
jgi:hypothetical protein